MSTDAADDAAVAAYRINWEADKAVIKEENDIKEDKVDDIKHENDDDDLKKEIEPEAIKELNSREVGAKPTDDFKEPTGDLKEPTDDIKELTPPLGSPMTPPLQIEPEAIKEENRELGIAKMISSTNKPKLYLDVRQWLMHYACTFGDHSPIDCQTFLPQGRKRNYYALYLADRAKVGQEYASSYVFRQVWRLEFPWLHIAHLRKS